MLLDSEKMRAICSIAASVGEVNYNIERAIETTEQIEIKSELGNLLFTDIEKNKTNYSILLNGGDYQYNNNTYSFKGLYYAIAWQSYVRYTKLSNANTTAYGTVFKNTDYSSQLDSSSMQIVINEYQSIASNYLNEVKLYLTRINNNLYINKGCEVNNRSINIEVIGG